jgi:hypothetical protein
MSENIIVYGDFTLDLKKYPRNGTVKGNTDIIIITFLMHEEELTKCAKSLDDAIKYFNGCKEYFYTYHTPNNVISPFQGNSENVKRYSAKEIIQLHTMLTNRPIRTNIEYYEFMKNFQYADQCYISYLRCRDFYMNLFKSIKSAKDAHFERRDYVYRVVPPMEIYGHMNNIIQGQTYSAYELMELFTFSHYLKNHRILKELPIPSFVKKIQEETNQKYMSRLYNPQNIYKNSKEREEGEEGEDGWQEGQEGQEGEKISLGSKLRMLKSIQYKNYQTQSGFESKNNISQTSVWDNKYSNIQN